MIIILNIWFEIRKGMKILVVSSYPPAKCGVGRYCRDLVGQLEKRNEVLIASYRGIKFKEKNAHGILYDKRKIRQEMNALLAEIIMLPVLLPDFLRLFGFAIRNKPNVIHLQYDISMYSAFLPPLLLLFKPLGIRLVITMHTRYAGLLGFFVKSFAVFFDSVVVHTKFHRDFLIEQGYPSRKISVMPIGAVRRPAIKQKIGAKTAYIMGFASPTKGYDVAIKAFESVVGKFPGAKLIIGGEPAPTPESSGYYRMLRSLAKELRLGKNVKFVGYVPDKDVKKYYGMSTVVLFPYSQVTQSAALCNAISYSMPVIVSDLPGFREVVQDGKNGFFVKYGDIDGLGKKLIALFSSPGLERMMRKNNKRLAEELCWENVGKKYEKLYGSFNK